MLDPAGFRARLGQLGVTPGSTLLVALSGGADSVALLHLCRFAAPDVRLAAAHFDHAMRRGSAADAAWVRGLCLAWGVPLHEGRAAVPPRSEGEARAARYAFLRAAQAEAGAAFLATAHHADDQAETVLLRILRGTGITGVRGIPAMGPEGLIRPLLPVWRAELRRYARRNRLRWRQDPSNRGRGPTRNRLRLELLPRLGEGIPARLVGLAQEAARLDRALEARAAQALDTISREEEGGLLLERAALATYDSRFAARVLRRVLRRFGTVLDRPGTRTALEFISSARSGRELILAGGRARLLTEFARVRVLPAGADPLPDAPLRIARGTGEGRARLGGRELRVRWRPGEPAAPDEAALDPAGAPFTVRTWLPGDRMRLAGGTRTLKKLFNEARVPRWRRARIPVVCDAGGRVVWVVGVARAADPSPPRGPALILSIVDA